MKRKALFERCHSPHAHAGVCDYNAGWQSGAAGLPPSELWIELQTPNSSWERNVKIRDVKVWLVEGVKYNWTMLKVWTDEGLTGIGEATNWPGSPIVFETCKHVAERVVGEDATRIDYLWSKLYRDLHWMGQAGPVLDAISALDIALWDIAGKRAGRPVYDLLGGAYRKAIPLYANYWFLAGDGSPPEYARKPS
jgi:galactonate dehydratase